MAITAITLAGCQSPQQKAQGLVINYLKETLNDKDSYESVSFSELDSLKSTWTVPRHLESDMKSLTHAIEGINICYHNIGFNIMSDADGLIKVIESAKKQHPEKAIYPSILQLLESFKHSQSKILEDMDSFVPEYLGWKITHKYRARNQYNALTLYHAEFHFDENLTGIINVTSAEE